jgi:hypothetical protein
MYTQPTHDHPPETVDGVVVAYRSLERFPACLFGDDGWAWSRASRSGIGAKWRRLSGSVGPGGYRTVTLRHRDGTQCHEYVHRLILEAFVSPCPNGMEACHEPDPDRLNNRLSNLRWDTRSANQLDAYQHPHKNLKVTVEQVHEIRRLRADGLTYRTIADRYRVTPQAIYLICKGKNRSAVPCEPAAAS